MAHFPKPFFKKARKSWYVEINRKQIKLGFDKEKAFQLYHQLMQQPANDVHEFGFVRSFVSDKALAVGSLSQLNRRLASCRSMD